MSQDVEKELWIKIENFIKKICSVHGTQYIFDITLYTDIYNYLTTPSLRRATSTTSSVRTVRSATPQEILGGDLYNHISDCLKEELQNICRNVNNMTNNDLLRLYQMYGQKHKNMYKCLAATCRYLTRHWVVRQHNIGRHDVMEVGELAQKIFESSFFKPLFPHATRACLDLINTNRNNQSIMDAELIKSILHLYLEKDFIEMMKNNRIIELTDDIYVEYFETEFLQQAKDFYYRQNIPSFEEDHILEYLISVGNYFAYEINLAKSYLPKDRSTLKILLNILEDLFIPNNISNVILEKIRSIEWNDNDYHELGKLYNPISQIPKIKHELDKIIENHIHQMGINAIQSVCQIALNDSKEYVETIFNVHYKFSKHAKEIFHNEPGFITALDKACGKFINNNAVTQTAGSTNKSSELLVRYCDALLRKGNKADDLTEQFNQIMIVFNYIDDKDVYQKFYGEMLAERFVNELSASNEYEETMILKLKQACGHEYTFKFEQMYRDIGISRDLNEQYRTYCENEHIQNNVKFFIMVLSSNSWPFLPPSNIVLPIELKSIFDSFTHFYIQHHNGRKLTWLYQHSKGELQTHFTTQKFTLQVSMYQMIVLLLFNKATHWTVEQIQNKTQIISDLLLEILYGLLKSKILTCIELHENFQEIDIHMDYTIKVADAFQSNKSRINLNVPFKSIEKKPSNNLDKIINEERKMVIQAAIVRIMKGKQTLEHPLLMQEVIQQLSSYFKPDVPLIKKCIDVLIVKDYLKRDHHNDKDIIRYLA